MVVIILPICKSTKSSHLQLKQCSMSITSQQSWGKKISAAMNRAGLASYRLWSRSIPTLVFEVVLSEPALPAFNSWNHSFVT